ncbi:MAG: hypothetical protein V1674_04300 [Candidatus Omnitrophota bacterium]
MKKQKSNNPNAAIIVLSSFILQSAESSRKDFEEREELKEISKDFNAQPFLKRFLDFSILYFWKATIACELYYEHDDFLKICDGIEKNIFKRFSVIETELGSSGLVLKDYVKDKDELALFYRNFPVEDETKVNSPVLLDILITKRLFDYNSTLRLDLAQQVQKVPSLFFKHVFGIAEYEYEKLENTMLHACLAVSISSFSSACAKLITEIEKSNRSNPLEEP